MTLYPISVILGMEVVLMYSTKEAAERLGLSQDHVKLLARKGLIKAKKVGRNWIVLDLTYKRKRKPKGG
ncbi:helix-turn-helix domain-containing protein [Chloroflexota bacterium]